MARTRFWRPVAFHHYFAHIAGSNCIIGGRVAVERFMGRFVTGLVIGLLMGLVFGESLFPDGFSRSVQHWADGVRSHVPGN